MMTGAEVSAYLQAQKDSLYQIWQAVGSVGGIQVTSNPPDSASADGIEGTITWSEDYIYVCTATNTWKRSALTTW